MNGSAAPMVGGVTLEPADTGGRVWRARQRFEHLGVDALLVTHLTNIRYLTGFTGSAGLLLVAGDRAVLVTDGRYADQAPAQVAAAGVAVEVLISSTDQRRLVLDAAEGVERIGLEAEHVSWAQHDRYRDEWFAGRALVPTAGVIEELRLIKDAGEVSRMRAAAAVTDAALAAVRDLLADGPTEQEFARALDGRIRELGASGNSFETIVASGPNAALPHARPGARRIQPGDPVIVDVGAVVDGYCSDMTRTFVVGDVSPELSRLVEVVGAAQAAGVSAVRHGVDAAEVDAATRAVIDDAGLGDRFTHGTGHGVGLDIHEAPRVARTSTATLAAGQVVTVEPGVYVPGLGGVRIEDTVVVTESGCRPLTLTPKTISVG